ncbi:MAG: ABC transporter permease [Bacteroidetes bacterium]|nr:ABC transporter permease [Bacteroidota bacterium]
MYKLYFKTAFRNLWKNRTYSFLNIFGLAIGIACAGLIFLWVEDELTFDDVHVKKQRLYQLNVNVSYSGSIFTMGSTPRPMAAALVKEIPGIVNASRISDEDRKVLFRFDDKSIYSSGRFTDSSLFNMFTFQFVAGNAKNPFSQLYSLVITEKAAKKFFGDDKNVVGKTVRVDNKKDYVISAIVKDPPENSTIQFEWLAPYDMEMVNSIDQFPWKGYGPFTYVELAANADPSTINKQLRNYIHRKQPDQTTEAFLFPMKNWRLYGEFANGKATGSGGIKQVRMLSMIAWIILLIACINFMNLSTASSQKRAKEVGVRKVLGAGKKGLMTQFIGEAMLLSTIAMIIAVFFIAFSLPAFNMLMKKNLFMNLLSPVHIIFLLLITVICGLVAGSYPSIYLSSFNPVLVFKGLKIKSGSASVIRKGLVVLQFTVSVVFIISTIVVYLQIQHVKNRNLGFNKENLVEINLHDSANNFFLLKEGLMHTGAVENVAITDHETIYGGNSDNRFSWEGKSRDNEINITFRDVSPEFISTSGMQIVAGRDFGPDLKSESSNAIITESLERLMGKGSAVGKIIQSPRGMDEGKFSNVTVVGVIKDYVYGNVFGGSEPVIILCKPLEERSAKLLYVRIKPVNNFKDVLSKIEAVVKKDNPTYPFEFRFVDEQFNEMFQSEALISKVSGTFAALAIIISCLGLFGLAAYTAERRTKEIGVRKVLGATVAGLAGLLSKDFLQLIFISFFIAFPIAWWMMHDWLQNYEYRIGISWWIFLFAGTIAIVIALATVSFQAIKAALANPVKSLRNE